MKEIERIFQRFMWPSSTVILLIVFVTIAVVVGIHRQKPERLCTYRAVANGKIVKTSPCDEYYLPSTRSRFAVKRSAE